MTLIDIYFSIIVFKIINLPILQPIYDKLRPYNLKKNEVN